MISLFTSFYFYSISMSLFIFDSFICKKLGTYGCAFELILDIKFIEKISWIVGRCMPFLPLYVEYIFYSIVELIYVDRLLGDHD